MVESKEVEMPLGHHPSKEHDNGIKNGRKDFHVNKGSLASAAESTSTESSVLSWIYDAYQYSKSHSKSVSSTVSSAENATRTTSEHASLEASTDIKIATTRSHDGYVDKKSAPSSQNDVPEPPHLRRGSNVPNTLTIPGAHRMRGTIRRSVDMSLLSMQSTFSRLRLVSAELITAEAIPQQSGNKPSTGEMVVEAKPLDKIPTLLLKDRKFQIGIGIVLVLICALVAGTTIGFSGIGRNSTPIPMGNNTVDEFMQILPTILSEKSLAQLETNGSPQALAVEWIHSIPSHTLLSMERLVQRFALAVFYYSTSGPSWSNNNGWLSDDHECSWFNSNNSPCQGVILTALELQENSLSGTIPEEVGLLTNLSLLNLRIGALFSTIPTTLGQLERMERMYLATNFLTGTIPREIWNLTRIERLVLGENQIGGNLSTQIGSLKRLQELYLSDNDFTGPIPTEIGRLSDLRILEISNTGLVGTVPTEIGALSEIRTLFLGGRPTLSGTVPEEIGNLTNVELLHLHDLTVTPYLFSRISQMEDLIELRLENSDLDGTIPSSFGNLARLTFLNLNENSLEGTIPAELTSMKNLGYLGLAENSFHGSLDPFASCTNLQILQLTGNSFSGTIPSAFEQFTNLMSLGLSGNRLEGNIPDALCALVGKQGSGDSSADDAQNGQGIVISVDCGRVVCTCCFGPDQVRCP